MTSLVIVGTDTGVGKTRFTGLLAKYLLEQRVNVVTQKWIQTGCETSMDLQDHWDIMGISGEAFLPYKKAIMPYALPFPGSPHLAAQKEGVSIESGRLLASTRALERQFECVLIEGSGGLLVPYSEEATLGDIVEQLKSPVLLVAGNKLGGINHTLLSIEWLLSRKIPVLGVVFVTSDPSVHVDIEQDNSRIVASFYTGLVMGALPYTENISQAYERAMPLLKTIADRLNP